MSSGRSSAESLRLHNSTLRAYLESHGIDPDAFAELPDDMKAEFLQSLPDNFGNTLESAMLTGNEADASVDVVLQSPLEQGQQDSQVFEPDSALVSDSSRDGSNSSYRESVEYESDNSADMQSGQPWMQPLHAHGLHHRSSPSGQAHDEHHFLAPRLNLELRELLESHGIDADAFVDMPDDIQSEILRTIPDVEDSASADSAADTSADNFACDHTPQSQQRRELPSDLGAVIVSPQMFPERPSLSLRPSPSAAPPPTNSRVIFSMGFDPALVTRALCASRDDEAQAVEMLLSGSVPSEGTGASTLRSSRSFVQQQPPRAAGAAIVPQMASLRARSSPQSRQDAVLEALHSRIFREAMLGAGGGDQDFLNMLQAAMQTNGRPASADEMIGDSELDEHSTTFIQSKDVDPSSTGENSQCSVCLVPFCKGDEVRLLPCMHMHHKECIDPWLRQKNQCPICRNPVIPSASASSISSHRLRRAAVPAAARPRTIRQAEPSRPPREPSRVFENMSRSISNARQAVTGFFARVSAQRPQQPVVASPAPAPAPATSLSPAFSPVHAQPASSPMSPAPFAMVTSPVTSSGSASVSRTSRLTGSCLPFGSFSSSSSGEDEGSSTSLTLVNADVLQAQVSDEPCSDQAETHARRPSLWRSLSSLWRDKSARGRGYQDMTRGPPS